MGARYSVVIDGKDYTPDPNTNISINVSSTTGVVSGVSETITALLAEDPLRMRSRSPTPRNELAESLSAITNIIEKRAVGSSSEEEMPELESYDDQERIMVAQSTPEPYQGAYVLPPINCNVITSFHKSESADVNLQGTQNIAFGESAVAANKLIQHDEEHAEVMRKAALRYNELRQMQAEERVQEVAKKHADARVKELEERNVQHIDYPAFLEQTEEQIAERNERNAQRLQEDLARAEELRRRDQENIARNEEIRLLTLQYNGEEDDNAVLLKAIQESRQEDEIMFGLSEEEALRLAILESEEAAKEATLEITPEVVQEIALEVTKVVVEEAPQFGNIVIEHVAPKVAKFVAWI